MPTVSIIYFSGSGHTAKLAEAVNKGAASVAGVKTNLIAINGDDITKGRYSNDAVFAQLDASNAIIFGSATYMGGPAAQFKAFADATGGRWFSVPHDFITKRRIADAATDRDRISRSGVQSA